MTNENFSLPGAVAGYMLGGGGTNGLIYGGGMGVALAEGCMATIAVESNQPTYTRLRCPINSHVGDTVTLVEQLDIYYNKAGNETSRYRSFHLRGE